ncbi:SRPBCC family protein [Streptomyces maoxianensis]|uniref:SRPBCC family protein n=1 Tax=Streptomyces maoxianensis TaxID=1459942 RepID=A0ABV9G156_9ACTN
MTVFRISRAVTLPADEAWLRVTDWRGHAAQVPLTTVSSVTPSPTRVGTVFVARSGIGRSGSGRSRLGRSRRGRPELGRPELGRFGFDDPMEVVHWQPPDGGAPGLCRLEKRGRVITGWAEIEVLPEGPGAVVVWVEELHIRLVPRLLDPLVARVARLVFGRALDGLLNRPRPTAMDAAGAADN